MSTLDPSNPVSSSERKRSFLSYLSLSDWVSLVAALAAFFTLFYFIVNNIVFIVNNIVEASIGEVKTEVALIRDDVSDTKTSLLSAFDEHEQSVNEVVEGALDQRTDEIARSIAKLFGEGASVIVRVANIPMDDPDVMSAVFGFTNDFASGTTMATFGDKAVVQSVVDDLAEEKTRSLQGMIDVLSIHPSVQTEIMFSNAANQAEATSRLMKVPLQE